MTSRRQRLSALTGRQARPGLCPGPTKGQEAFGNHDLLGWGAFLRSKTPDLDAWRGEAPKLHPPHTFAMRHSMPAALTRSISTEGRRHTKRVRDCQGSALTGSRAEVPKVPSARFADGMAP